MDAKPVHTNTQSSELPKTSPPTNILNKQQTRPDDATDIVPTSRIVNEELCLTKPKTSHQDTSSHQIDGFSNPYVYSMQANHSQTLQLPNDIKHQNHLNDVITPSPNTPNSTKELLRTQSSATILIDCVGRRRQPIGEKCFALITIFFVLGLCLASFGATCMIPQLHQGESIMRNSYCSKLGGLPTSLVLVSGGALLILTGVASCVLVNECSGKELHGGKCHINCHIFEDLVE